MPGEFRWKPGWDDIVPFVALAAPMLLETFLAGSRTRDELILVTGALVIGFALKRWLPATLEPLVLIAPVIALLVEIAALRLTVVGLLLAAAAGAGLLLWAGAEPTSGVSLTQYLEPALVPALAVSLAVVVMLFLPAVSGGQVGLAVLVLVAVLGLSAWLYLRSAAEASDAVPTS
jgi:hypothetical protein